MELSSKNDQSAQAGATTYLDANNKSNQGSKSMELSGMANTSCDQGPAQAQGGGNVVTVTHEEDDSVCDVCRGGMWTEGNLIVFCEGEGCHIAVHQECYGCIKIPEGDDPWYCDVCNYKRTLARMNNIPSVTNFHPKEIHCRICKGIGGAMKQLNSRSPNKWVHVCCVLALPETQFRDPIHKEEAVGVFSLNIMQRANLRCIYCTREFGACLKCSVRGCNTAFHVRCAQLAGLEIDTKRNTGAFCAQHVSIGAEAELQSGRRGSSRYIHIPTINKSWEESVDSLPTPFPSQRYTSAEIWQDVEPRFDSLAQSKPYEKLLQTTAIKSHPIPPHNPTLYKTGKETHLLSMMNRPSFNRVLTVKGPPLPPEETKSSSCSAVLSISSSEQQRKDDTQNNGEQELDIVADMLLRYRVNLHRDPELLCKVIHHELDDKHDPSMKASEEDVDKVKLDNLQFNPMMYSADTDLEFLERELNVVTANNLHMRDQLLERVLQSDENQKADLVIPEGAKLLEKRCRQLFNRCPFCSALECDHKRQAREREIIILKSQNRTLSDLYGDGQVNDQLFNWVEMNRRELDRNAGFGRDLTLEYLKSQEIEDHRFVTMKSASIGKRKRNGKLDTASASGSQPSTTPKKKKVPVVEFPMLLTVTRTGRDTFVIKNTIPAPKFQQDLQQQQQQQQQQQSNGV